jgi:acyl-homoserine lactone acylase PvdQ
MFKSDPKLSNPNPIRVLIKNSNPTTVNTPFWKLHSLAIEPRFHDLGDLANFTYMKTRLYSQMT